MADLSPVVRSKLIGVVLLAGAGAAALYAGLSLIHPFNEIARHAPFVALDAIDATGFLAALGLVLIGMAALLPVTMPPPTKRRHALPKIPPAARPLMVAAAFCIVASPISAPIVRGIVASRAEDGGYVRCPRTPWPRKQPERWALAAATCPKGDPAP